MAETRQPVVVTVPAQQSTAEAIVPDDGRAAAVALGLDDVDMADQSMQSWAAAFGSMEESKPDKRDLAAMRSAGMELKKKIRLLCNSESCIHKLQDEVSSLSEGRVPSGLKLFKLVFESPSWDVKFSKAGGKSEILFPENCTRAEAKEILHVEFLKLNRLIDPEFEQHRKETLASETSIDQFRK